MADERIALLSSMAFFKDLDESETKAVADIMEEMKVEKGDHIIREGEITSELFVIADGHASVLKNDDAHGPASPTTGPVKILTLHRGDFVGLGTLLERTAHSATVVADSSPLVLYKITHEKFNELIAARAKLAVSLCKYLNKELRIFRNKVADLSDRDGKDDGTENGGKTLVKMVVFDFKKYEQSFFDDAIKHLNAEFDASPDMPKKIKLIPKFFEVKLSADTINLAQGAQIVCIFVNDTCDASILTRLSELGVQMIALRCAGFNNVDLEACKALGISVVRVPAYSPYAVAEHCVALLSTLNRKLHIAYNRVKTGNFSLTSLTGFDIRGKTVGVIGTGKIGVCFIKIMLGFGANVVGYDPYKSKELEGVANFRYVEEIAELLSVSKILSIHVPLTDKNKYLINKDTLALMPKGAIIVNTSRGGLVHTGDLIDALKSGHIGGAGLDVYEDESEYFFEDKSGEIIRDEKLARLLTLKNVIVTSHQAFLTNEALHAIANTTIFNIREFLVEGKAQKALTNSVNLA